MCAHICSLHMYFFLKPHFYIIGIICFLSLQQNVNIYPCQQIFILAYSVLHSNHVDVLLTQHLLSWFLSPFSCYCWFSQFCD